MNFCKIGALLFLKYKKLGAALFRSSKKGVLCYFRNVSQQHSAILCVNFYA
jgi:hypothetical protein